jgi:hypothetical protein
MEDMYRDIDDIEMEDTAEQSAEDASTEDASTEDASTGVAAKQPVKVFTLDELDEAFDSQPEYVEQSFSLPNGKQLVCKLKVWRDGDEWAEFAKQLRHRQQQATSKGGLKVTLPDSTVEVIRDKTKVAMLTYAEFGLLEPAMRFTELVDRWRRTGSLIPNIASKVMELNDSEAIEQAKNASGQEPGNQTPGSPA